MRPEKNSPNTPTMYSRIASVIPGHTPTQNVRCMTASVLVSSPTTRYSTPSNAG